MKFNKEAFRADLITKRMIENRMTFDEVSRESGVPPNTLCKLERGSVPHMETFAKVCEWMDKNPSVYFY